MKGRPDEGIVAAAYCKQNSLMSFASALTIKVKKFRELSKIMRRKTLQFLAYIS